MSKGISGLFSGTSGIRYAELQIVPDLIASRVAGLDLREHPRGKSLTAKQRREIKDKIKNRTASRTEYTQYMSDTRFLHRRQEGVRQFWREEKARIVRGQQTTRKWSDTQRQSILQNSRPKYNGRTLQGHHTYSATKYPHLANQGAIIFPVTFDEHLYGWHGGNFKNSLPGQPIKQRTYHTFTGGKKK